MTILAAWISIVAPCLGAATTPLLARIHPRLRDLAAVGCSLVSAAAALSLIPTLFHPEQLPVEHTMRWLERPFPVEFGVLVDPLSVVLANVVAVISSIIMIYCVGYMHGDAALTRFWMWMNGFIGSMLLLVLSSNLLFMFVGWKLVGVCSYGLIGFYYQDQRKYWIGGPEPTAFVKPSEACLKALVVTGLGDMLMLGGILLLYFYAGALNFLELYATAPTWFAHLAEAPGLVILMTLLLLAGPLGKSAQFPFHEWLPEAMAGPGPVSALIHAATMVKSGVYLVARLAPIFFYGYWVAGHDDARWFFTITAWVGAITAFLAATQGLVALELKKVLAYSTVSQIGYMLLALGVAGLSPGLLLNGYTAGLFHLVSHALFKACLFLCAGTVIHAVHSFYLTDMGATRRYLPWTWICMLIASASLMGLPPFPGFWSKDAVLLSALDGSWALFGLALVTAAITAFYTVRCFGLVFHGAPSTHITHLTKDEGTASHLDDGPATMRFAIALLAMALVVAGLGGRALEHFLHHAFEVSGFDDALQWAVQSAAHGGTAVHSAVPWLSVLVVLIGAAPAYVLYLKRHSTPQALFDWNAITRRLQIFFWNRWGMDHAFMTAFVTGPQRCARWIATDCEARLDRLVHHRLPWAFTRQIQRVVEHLRADTEEMLYNVSYVLILLGTLLVYLFLGAAGG